MTQNAGSDRESYTCADWLTIRDIALTTYMGYDWNLLAIETIRADRQGF